MRYIIAIFLTSFLLFGTAHAKNDQIQFGPVPNWVKPSELLTVPEEASGLLFVRRQDILVHLDEQGQLHYVGSRIKILHPNALQIGNLSIAWNPAAGVPTVHTVKVHRDGEVIDVGSEVSFEILRREDQLEAAMLDGVLTAVARVPDLRVGDELELAFTTAVNDPTLGNKSAGLLVLQPNPSLGRFRLGLNWIKGQEPAVKMTGEMANVVQKKERSLDFHFDNPSNLAPPKDAPPRYNWLRVVEFSDFSEWSDISQHFVGLFEEAATIPDASPIKKEASRIASKHASDFDRANAALTLVQQNVRYIYVGLDRGNLTPASAEETWQRRYGDCKGKTALLLGLLSELGIEAEAVLASNAGIDDGLDLRLPNPGMFDHVLVRAKIDGKQYYMDGTLPSVVPPSTNPVYPYRWILPLTEKGSSIERLEWQPASKPDKLNLFEIDARDGFDKPARKTSTVITRGIKGLGEQVQFSGLTPGQLFNAMSQHMIGDTWQTIDDIKWKYDEKEQASVLTIVGMGTVDWDDDGDGDRSLALPGGGFSPPKKRIRSPDQDQDLPYYSKPEFDCHVTTVRLPGDTDPKHWSFKKGYDTLMFGRNYYRIFDLREGAIRMIRSSRVEEQEVAAEEAKWDNDRISDFDNSMGWVYYRPSRMRFIRNNSKNVPTTYDVDWVADSSACLSPTAQN